MDIYLSAADNPTYRDLLIASEVEKISMAWSGLRRRGVGSLKGRFDPEIGITVEAGSPPDGAAPEEIAQEYLDFVVASASAVDFVTDLDYLPEDLKGELWEALDGAVGSRVLPTWSPEDGPSIRDLFGSFGGLSIRSRDLSDSILPLLRMGLQKGLQVLVLGGGVDVEPSWCSAVTTSVWRAPERRGDLVLWDGRGLRRYPHRRAQSALRRHRSKIDRSGFDSDAILTGDAKEATRLAIWSVQRFSESLAANGHPRKQPDPPQIPSGELAIGPSEPPETRSGGNLLPILRETTRKVPEIDESGHQTGWREEDHIEVSDTMLRCDNCILSERCPQSKPGASCAYRIPVNLKTPEDTTTFLRAMLEMQGQRALFARFSEELQGGFPDEITGKELERFFKLAKTLSEIEDDRDVFRMSVEARGNTGIISQIFGSQMGSQARQSHEEPVDASPVVDIDSS